MEQSQSSFPTASHPDVTAFTAEVQARISQYRALPPEVVQGLERLGRWIQVLRTRQSWSLSTLASRTGLPWLWLALLEQGLLLPDEFTEEQLHTLGQAFPLQHTGPAPELLFPTLARHLCTLRLPVEEVPATQNEISVLTPAAPAAPTAFESYQAAVRPSLRERLVRWCSPLWQPSLAGVPMTAAAAPTQQHVFYLDEGTVQVTCTWWNATPQHPAALWIAWQADVAQAGTFWVRFTRPEEAAGVLAELPLGSALAGEEVFGAKELGFDPTCVPWALAVMLRELEP